MCWADSRSVPGAGSPGDRWLAARPGVAVGRVQLQARVRLPREPPRGAGTWVCGQEEGPGWDSGPVTQGTRA